MFLNDDRAGVSKTARRVLSKEINAGDADILLIGQSALESWKLGYNQSFTVPSSNQIVDIRKH